MASDFIDELIGLCLLLEELERGRIVESNFPRKARELFEYGAARDGYWMGEKFTDQIEKV